MTTTPGPSHSRAPWTRPEEELAGAKALRSSIFSRADRHGDPALRRAWRATARIVVNDPYPDQYAQAIAACQQPVTTGRRIGVVSPVGGAGRSTVTAALGLLYSSARIDHITAADLSGLPSGLLPRLPAEGTPAGLRSLAQLASGRTAAGHNELLSCSARIGETLHRGVLAEGEAHLGPEEIPALHQLLSRTCAVSVLELPPLSSPHGSAALHGLHAVILAVPAVPAAAQHSRAVLEQLRSAAPMVPVLPVLTNPRRAGVVDRRLTAQTLTAELRAVGRPTGLHQLDHDRHLAAGERLRLMRIGERRRLQIAQLAAAALTAAQEGDR